MARGKRRRRFYLDTSVPLSAFFGDPGTLAWLGRHGRESVYTKLLRRELRRARHAVDPTAVLNMLRGFGVAEEPVDAGRLLRRARKLLVEGRVRGSLLDVAHVLAARELRKIVVTQDRGVERTAKLLGVPAVLVGAPRGPKPRGEEAGRGEGPRGGGRRDR